MKPNDACPCWSGRKYKHCCRGHVDWDRVIRSGSDHIRLLSARGRNILFAQRIFEALQIDNERDVGLKEYKAAFTPEAVRRIYEAIAEIWPTDTDIESVLRKSQSDVAGIYVGDYDGFYVRRAVVRHSLYASKILLIEPFVHPNIISDEYNPILNPDQHRSQTLKNVNTFLSFLPWIDAGLVEFIRTPADFDRKLAWDSMQRTSLWKLDPSLAELSRRSVDEIKGRHQQKLLRDTHLLAAPDDYVLRKLKEAGIAQTGAEQGQFLAYMQRLRDEDPDFLEQVRPGERYAQLAMMTTGGAIENARLAAQMTGAYLFTDIELRWHLIKRDRAEHSAEEIQWSPFAKAMQGAKLTYLNNVGIEHALRLRQEGRLSGVRSVLRDAWLREQTGDVYDDVNTLRFAENLADAVSAADAEWSELKADLLKHGVVEGAAGLLAAGPLVAAGQSLWLAGAAATAIAGSAIYGRFRHRAFLKRFPAAFFMHLEGAD